MDRNVYVVVSQTGTILSRILKSITKKEYNHASISLNKNLAPMYSFGRMNPYNPVWGGFVLESIHAGTFKRFKNTKAIVLELPFDDKDYEDLKMRLKGMIKNSDLYGYNYLGLVLAGVRINWSKRNAFYCSEFVKDLLIMYRVKGYENLVGIVHPIQFLNLPEARVVYRGKLRDYKYNG